MVHTSGRQSQKKSDVHARGAKIADVLEHLEAALDVGERLVARDDFCQRERGVGDQEQLAGEPFGLGQRRLVAREAEEVGMRVGLEEATPSAASSRKLARPLAAVSA